MAAVSKRVGTLLLILLATSTGVLSSLQGQESVSGNPKEGRSLLTAPFLDLWGATADFGRDTWRVASSPSRLNQRSALELGGVLLVGGILFAIDEDVNEALDAAADPEGSRGLLRGIGDFVEPLGLQGDTNIYFAGAAVLGYLTQQDWIKDPAKQILYSQWIGGLGRQMVGHLVGRQRPHKGEGAYLFEPGEGTSFPSGHSAVAFELAYVLSHHIDRWPASVLLYGLAGTMAFQRADSNSHWASDALIGSAWGFLVAKTVVAAEESDRVEFQPLVDYSTGRTGLGLKIRF